MTHANLAARRARVAVTATFAAHGLPVGSWAPRIPELKSHLGLTSGSLGLALLAPAVGTILVMRPAGSRITQFGSRRATAVGSVVFAAAAVLPTIATNLGEFFLGLLLWGAAMGAFDIAMNTQGVTVETGYGRPVLSGFHATWSLGCFAGAVIGGVGSALGTAVWAQQTVVGVVAIAIVLTAQRSFLVDPPHAADEASTGRRRWTVPEGRLVLLGAAAVFALMAEGAVTDWSGVLLRDHLHVSAGRIGLGYTAFCVTMTVGRFAGDRVVHTYGRVRPFLLLGGLGALGLSGGLVLDSVGATVAGFAVLGLGLAVMVPVLYSAAADTEGPAAPAIATVAALGCVGLLGGPSLIGGVAQLAGVHTAVLLLAPFTLVAAVLGVLGIRRSGSTRRVAIPAAR